MRPISFKIKTFVVAQLVNLVLMFLMGTQSNCWVWSCLNVVIQISKDIKSINITVKYDNIIVFAGLMEIDDSLLFISKRSSVIQFELFSLTAFVHSLNINLSCFQQTFCWTMYYHSGGGGEGYYNPGFKKNVHPHFTTSVNLLCIHIQCILWDIHENWTLGCCSETISKTFTLGYTFRNSQMETCQWNFKFD